MRQMSWIVLALIAAAAPGRSLATTLACRPGVTVHTYAQARFHVPRSGASRLHRQLDHYAAAKNLNYSSVGSDDPGERPPYHSMTSFLQTRRFGLALSVDTSNRSDVAKVRIENNCWARHEDWRSAWTALTIFLERSGYRRIGPSGKR